MGPAIASASVPAGLSALTDLRLPLDETLLRLLNGLSSPPVDAVTSWLGKPLLDWSVAALAMLWMLAELRKRALVPLLFAMLAVAVSDLVGARLLKPWFHRMRPFDALPGVHQAFAVSHLGSMPSLHAANAFTLAAALGGALPRLAPWVYGFAALISLSRVVGGVHWPSDIVVGALLGTALGLAAAWAARRTTRAS